jgi:hypothetical protein
MCRALVRLYAERAVRTGLASFIRHRSILEDATLGRAGGPAGHRVEEILTRQDVQRRPRRRWAERDERGHFARKHIW